MLEFIPSTAFVNRLALDQFTYLRLYVLLIKRVKKSIQSGYIQ